MGQQSRWSHSVVLSAEPASASRAREFVCLHLLSSGLMQLQDDLQLVVSELVSNAIRHARTPFTVALERAGPSLILTVSDSSPSVPEVNEPDTMGGGGRGLVIVEVLSEAWGVTHDGAGSKSVWASFDIEGGVVATS